MIKLKLIVTWMHFKEFFTSLEEALMLKIKKCPELLRLKNRWTTLTFKNRASLQASNFWISREYTHYFFLNSLSNQSLNIDAFSAKKPIGSRSNQIFTKTATIKGNMYSKIAAFILLSTKSAAAAKTKQNNQISELANSDWQNLVFTIFK